MTLGELLGTASISIVSAAGAGWLGVKTFAGKWLDNRFAGNLEGVRLAGQKQLEDIRILGQTQLEEIKHEHAGDLDRAVKLNQREFEVIPEIWLKGTEAHYAILRLIAMWQESPVLTHMGEAEFESFLSKSRLEDWQKEEIRAKSRFDRTTYYSDLSRWFRLNDANEAVIKFNHALLGSSIFIHPATHTKFEEFARHFRSAYGQFKSNMQMGDDFRLADAKPDDPANFYRENGERLYEELGRYLRERYWKRFRVSRLAAARPCASGLVHVSRSFLAPPRSSLQSHRTPSKRSCPSEEPLRRLLDPPA
ncbi:MAG: hypothetical protein EOP06_07245 [Proteobacteria bacterium]|nr:MAG: hypothetical protein EOP06_07245 [Pseudomonadota bacterium]